MMWKTVCTIMQSHKDICKTGHFFTFTYNPFGNPVDFRLFTNIRKHKHRKTCFETLAERVLPSGRTVLDPGYSGEIIAIG